MAAILKSKMAAKRPITSNFVNACITIHGIPSQTWVLPPSGANFVVQKLRYRPKILKMAAILKSKMAATGTDEKMVTI